MRCGAMQWVARVENVVSVDAAVIQIFQRKAFQVRHDGAISAPRARSENAALPDKSKWCPRVDWPQVFRRFPQRPAENDKVSGPTSHTSNESDK